MTQSHVIEMRDGAERPNTKLTWLDSDGAPIDFSSGYTWTVWVRGVASSTNELAKTSGVTGSAGGTTAVPTPNVDIAWSAVDLTAIALGRSAVQVRARHTASGLDRDYPKDITFIKKASLG